MEDVIKEWDRLMKQKHGDPLQGQRTKGAVSQLRLPPNLAPFVAPQRPKVSVWRRSDYPKP